MNPTEESSIPYSDYGTTGTDTVSIAETTANHQNSVNFFTIQPTREIEILAALSRVTDKTGEEGDGGHSKLSNGVPEFFTSENGISEAFEAKSAHGGNPKTADRQTIIRQVESVGMAPFNGTNILTIGGIEYPDAEVGDGENVLTTMATQTVRDDHIEPDRA